MSDGYRYDSHNQSHRHFILNSAIRLRQSWQNALNDAESHCRQLLASSQSTEWKRIVNQGGSSSHIKGKTRVPTIPELSDVVIHRMSSKSGEDIYRILLDVPTGEDAVSLDHWKAVLATPELRQEWDPAVEEAHLVEVFDQTSRIVKTKFTLGWPAKFVSSILCKNSNLFGLTADMAVLETLLLFHVHSMMPQLSLISPRHCLVPLMNQLICGPLHRTLDPM